ncbi:hypothetical protein RIF29_27163 [Crotalaria pallida]|uniref:Uncharacterized protein n=1 Tax=Crotalaria pallida TaxID=3830 RepID=A0AAN9ENK8_CROPI
MAKKKEQKQETQRTDQSKKVTQETQKTSFKNAIPTQASPKAKDIHGKSSGKNPPLKPHGIKVHKEIVGSLGKIRLTWDFRQATLKIAVA